MICIFHACSELCSCRISKNKSNGNIKTLIWSRNRTCYLTLPWILYYEILVVWCFDSVEDKVCLDLHSILSYYFVYLLLYLLLSLIHLIHCWSWANWLKEPFFFWVVGTSEFEPFSAIFIYDINFTVLINHKQVMHLYAVCVGWLFPSGFLQDTNSMTRSRIHQP